MSEADDDWAAVERMSDGFNAAERDSHEDAEREIRRRQRRQAPAALRVNVDEHLITSPSGAFTDAEVEGLERKHREDVERFGRRFGRH